MRRRVPAVLLLIAALAAAGCHHRKELGSENAVSQQFLAKNRKQPGVIVLADGLQYKVVRTGPSDGAHPQKGDEIKVDYTGSLVDGSVFDSTRQSGQPAILKLDHLVPGWMEALPKMRPGDEWILFVPPNLGYGAEGRPPVIPPNSVLVFDLSLLGVLPGGGSTGLALGPPARSAQTAGGA